MTESQAIDVTPRAAFMMLTAMFAFAVQDAIVKLISADVSIWQFHLTRAVMVLGITSVMIGSFRPMSGVKLVNPGWAALRSLFMAGAFVFFYLAMPMMSLSQAAATFFTGPLFITLLSALFVGERVGPRRVAALLLGFAGVLVIVRPWSEAFGWAALFPLGAAVSYALAIIITRSRCLEDSAVALSLVQSIVFAQVGLGALVILDLTLPSQESIAAFPFLLTGWGAVSGTVWLFIACTAVTHVIGAILLTRVYQTAPASSIAPLEYTYLIMAPLLDLAIWGVAPDGATLLGIAMIAGAGSFVAWREGTPVRPRPQTHEGAAPDDG